MRLNTETQITKEKTAEELARLEKDAEIECEREAVNIKIKKKKFVQRMKQTEQVRDKEQKLQFQQQHFNCNRDIQKAKFDDNAAIKIKQLESRPVQASR